MSGVAQFFVVGLFCALLGYITAPVLYLLDANVTKSWSPQTLPIFRYIQAKKQGPKGTMLRATYLPLLYKKIDFSDAEDD